MFARMTTSSHYSDVSRKILMRFKENLERSEPHSVPFRRLPIPNSFTFFNHNNESVNGARRALYGGVR